jgi:hypothetical protein
MNRLNTGEPSAQMKLWAYCFVHFQPCIALRATITVPVTEVLACQGQIEQKIILRPGDTERA